MGDAVERVQITVVIDNHVDMLLTDRDGVGRFGLMQHFVPPHGHPVATENGIAYWIELQRGERHYRILFDTGLTSTILLANLAALGLSPDQIDRVVLSHAHPDHFGGLMGLLDARSQPLEIVVNPDAFLPKYFLNSEKEVLLRLNRGFDRQAIERAGGVIIESRDPVELAPGAFATGYIEREVAFEPPVPVGTGGAGAYVDKDGEYVNDDAVLDDQAVVLNVAGKGLVVMTACGHAGVINSIRKAQRITGVDQVYAVMGGFHTGFPGVPPESGDATVEALREIAPQIVAPMHCTGIVTIAKVIAAFPDQFLHNVVGTKLTIA